MRGSVVKRGATYTIIYDVGKASDGKRQQKTQGGFKNKRDAEKAPHAKIAEFESSYAKRLEKASLACYLNNWLVTYCEPRLARNTVVGYRNNIENHIIPCLGEIPLCDVKPEHIDAMGVQLKEKGLSPTSMLYVYRVLHKAFASALKSRVVMNNPLDYVDFPKKEHFMPTILSDDEIVRLLTACKDSEIYIPVLLVVCLGMRRGETLGLKWDCVDFQKQTLEVCRTATFYKGGEFCLSAPKTQNSRRTIQTAGYIAQALKEHKAAQEACGKAYAAGEYNAENLVVCRIDGSPLSSAVLQKQFKALLKRCGLPDMRFHDLRHTYATLMLKNNIPAKIVSSILGHSSISITMDIYSHVMTSMQQPAVEVIENLFSVKR